VGHFRALLGARAFCASSSSASRAAECQALAASFTDGQAAEGLAITEELRAVFQRPAAASSVVAGPMADGAVARVIVRRAPRGPVHRLSIILQLDIRALTCLAATCRLLWCDTPTPTPPLPTPGLVETELRRRAEARGLYIGPSLPEGTLSWVPYLLKRDFYDALRREAPLAVGDYHSHFVDKEGRLHLTCLRDEIKAGGVGEPLLGHDWGSDAGASTVSVPPTLLPSIHDTRIVSVASGDRHCLALSAVGEVYSWGNGLYGVLGHADGSARVGPRRIEALEGVENIAAGMCTSAAVDNRGRLFTWGRGASGGTPTGLGYELDPATECQLTPKRVNALSEDRVMGVALGLYFTLVVTDAGAVFSFGEGRDGALGHGFSMIEVLPRRIEALAEMGRRLVFVAAGWRHSLALTEEGLVYAWGHGTANGHGQGQRTPQLVTALAGIRVLLVYAQGFSACAVTERGELYTWGEGHFDSFHLGHGFAAGQQTPKRVEALRGVKVAAAAIYESHTLVAGDDGVVWGFGRHVACCPRSWRGGRAARGLRGAANSYPEYTPADPSISKPPPHSHSETKNAG